MPFYLSNQGFLTGTYANTASGLGGKFSIYENENTLGFKGSESAYTPANFYGKGGFFNLRNKSVYVNQGELGRFANLTVTLSYLIVAGGGAGGKDSCGGGGGGGGLLTNTALAEASTGLTITVGAGGTTNASASPTATNGANSVIAGLPSGTITAIGGGRGGDTNPAFAQRSGGNGGSGGGGAFGSPFGVGGTGTSGQGFNGGAGVGGGDASSGGGGGAGGGGGNQTARYGTAGSGGVGAYSSISGTNTAYAGGGGGSGSVGLYGAGTGGVGGGGDGAFFSPGANGGVNTGGGGGGGGTVGGNGGSGIVIVAYNKLWANATATGTFAYSEANNNRIFTFTANGGLTFPANTAIFT